MAERTAHESRAAAWPLGEGWAHGVLGGAGHLAAQPAFPVAAGGQVAGDGSRRWRPVGWSGRAGEQVLVQLGQFGGDEAAFACCLFGWPHSSPSQRWLSVPGSVAAAELIRGVAGEELAGRAVPGLPGLGRAASIHDLLSVRQMAAAPAALSVPARRRYRANSQRVAGRLQPAR